MPRQLARSLALLALTLIATPTAAQSPAGRPLGSEYKVALPADDARLRALKAETVRRVDSMATFTQQAVDQIFSYGELGFQETETSAYITGILERNGFTVERGTAGMPTAWVARWGAGKPVIALGSDIDGIPQTSQKPGVAYRAPVVEGAPGHGEGHNSGQAVNITAALALKAIMQRDRIPGTIVLWPGVAEELLGAKAYLVRAGVFKDVDVALFSHVDDNLVTSWGGVSGNGVISAEFGFRGTSAHSAGSPWRGRSALDAVQLMDIGWNFRREHLRLQQRSHSVIRDGGDQPNVVPSTASIWFYFRETDAAGTRSLFALGDTIARAAAMMTSTRLDTVRILGTAWPAHFSKPIAEAMNANMRQVGLPKWSDDDQRLAKGIQKELGVNPRGLDTTLDTLEGPIADGAKRGGGSDDIGDVSWVVPTVSLRFPSNIPDLPGHNWANAISMATPIAHKGATAGAKAQAMTMLDLLLKPELLRQAKEYFTDVQTKELKYTPLMRAADQPAIEMNAGLMARYREEMRKYYYDPTRYKTYLEQLGITYPTVR